MNETDKIFAAILAASMCGKTNSDSDTYLQTYEEFLEKMTKRHHEKHKMPPVPKGLIERIKRTGRKR